MNNFHEITPPRASEVAETLIFQEIWKRVPNKSFVSGLWLRDFYRTPLWKNCFLNIIPVKDYPNFRFYCGNIVLLTPGERALYLQCTPESLIHYALDIEERTGGKATANWKAIDDLKAELLVIYKKHFPFTYKHIIGYKYPMRDVELIVGHLNAEFWDSFK
ncbi:MAG: hypothetical protein JJE45_00300 [Prolixibacteraceae bacterium]|nr:hypothetical protein [Prolixibacteraceae bacterium]